MSVLGCGGLATVFTLTGERNRYAVKLVADHKTAEDEAAVYLHLGSGATTVGFHGRVSMTGEVQHEFLLLELCHKSLHDAVMAMPGQRLANPASLATQQQVAMMVNCVAQLHSRGVIHQDIKPSNFLLGQDCTIKLCDFNLSRLATNTARIHGGTVLYFSPHMLSNLDEGYAADWWALGVTLYQVLHGLQSWPFSSQPLPKLDKLPPAEQLELVRQAVIKATVRFRPLCGLPRAAKTLIRGLLHPQPEKRWSLLQVLSGDYPGDRAFSAVALRFPQLSPDMERLLALRRLCRSAPVPRRLPAPAHDGEEGSGRCEGGSGRRVGPLRSIRALGNCLAHSKRSRSSRKYPSAAQTDPAASDQDDTPRGDQGTPARARAPVQQQPSSPAGVAGSVAPSTPAYSPAPAMLPPPVTARTPTGVWTGRHHNLATTAAAATEDPSGNPTSRPEWCPRRDNGTDPVAENWPGLRHHHHRCSPGVACVRLGAVRRALLPRSAAAARAAAAHAAAVAPRVLVTSDGRLAPAPFAPCDLRTHEVDMGKLRRALAGLRPESYPAGAVAATAPAGSRGGAGFGGTARTATDHSGGQVQGVEVLHEMRMLLERRRVTAAYSCSGGGSSRAGGGSAGGGGAGLGLGSTGGGCAATGSNGGAGRDKAVSSSGGGSVGGGAAAAASSSGGGAAADRLAMLRAAADTARRPVLPPLAALPPAPPAREPTSSGSAAAATTGPAAAPAAPAEVEWQDKEVAATAHVLPRRCGGGDAACGRDVAGRRHCGRGLLAAFEAAAAADTSAAAILRPCSPDRSKARHGHGAAQQQQQPKLIAGGATVDAAAGVRGCGEDTPDGCRAACEPYESSNVGCHIAPGPCGAPAGGRAAAAAERAGSAVDIGCTMEAGDCYAAGPTSHLGGSTSLSAAEPNADDGTALERRPVWVGPHPQDLSRPATFDNGLEGSRGCIVNVAGSHLEPLDSECSLFELQPATCRGEGPGGIIGAGSFDVGCEGGILYNDPRVTPCGGPADLHACTIPDEDGSVFSLPMSSARVDTARSVGAAAGNPAGAFTAHKRATAPSAFHAGTTGDPPLRGTAPYGVPHGSSPGNRPTTWPVSPLPMWPCALHPAGPCDQDNWHKAPAAVLYPPCAAPAVAEVEEVDVAAEARRCGDHASATVRCTRAGEEQEDQWEQQRWFAVGNSLVGRPLITAVEAGTEEEQEEEQEPGGQAEEDDRWSWGSARGDWKPHGARATAASAGGARGGCSPSGQAARQLTDSRRACVSHGGAGANKLPPLPSGRAAAATAVVIAQGRR